MIPRETIQTILDTARIEDVVGDFVQLKKRGVNLLGLCPFHNEKTPSFTVSPTKGIFKCFGCSESGNSVNFVMKHEHLTYPQALVYLAKKYGIEVVEEEQSDENKKEEAHRESMMLAVGFAQKHFTKNLHETIEGKAIGLQYFNERAISEPMLEKFQLGYGIDNWDNLFRAAIEKGYSEEILIETGLLVKSDEGKIYDRFRGRVIFPIHNISGRVIGFGGRILDSSKNKAKYVNSPESEIYHKSDVLYGFHLARNSIAKLNNCYLVEGYTDVIGMHQSGIENVVASSGTSLTTGQIKLIRRFTKNITILYDGDWAGIKASFRGIDMIIEEGMNVRVVLFPDGDDPDSFARKHSSTEVQEFINTNAKDFIKFKADLLMKDAGTDPMKKAEVVREIIRSIGLIPEQLDRMFFIRETSDLLDIEENILINEVNKTRRNQLFEKQKFSPPNEPHMEVAYPVRQQKIEKKKDIYQEKGLIRILLNYGSLTFKPSESKLSLASDTDKPEQEYNVAQYVVYNFTNDKKLLPEDVSMMKIFEEYENAVLDGTLPSENYFTNHHDDEIRNNAIDLITEAYELSPNWEKHGIFIEVENSPLVLSRLVVSGIFELKIKKIDKLIEEKQNLLKDANLNETEEQKILQEIISLTKVRNMMNNDLGRIILG